MGFNKAQAQTAGREVGCGETPSCQRVMKCWGSCLSPLPPLLKAGSAGEEGQQVPSHYHPPLLALCVCLTLNMHFALLTSCGDLD